MVSKQIFNCKWLKIIDLINFFLLRTFVFILVVFLLFFFSYYVSAKFHLWPSLDRNAESCNHIPSNYCLHKLLFIAPRFWPNKPLAGLGRNWNRYLLTMLTWNRRDSTPLSAVPRAPKDDQGWIFFGMQ